MYLLNEAAVRCAFLQHLRSGRRADDCGPHAWQRVPPPYHVSPLFDQPLESKMSACILFGCSEQWYLPSSDDLMLGFPTRDRI